MKTKKAFLNFITDIIPLVIISILGIFKLKYFIKFLGDDTLGLYQLFSNIMVYIALVDGGLASAVIYSLYKPNVEGDKEKINELLSGAFRAFSLIGAIVFFIAALISFILPFFIKDNSFSYWYTSLSFILFSLSNVFGYFFVPYQAILDVKEKKYIFNLISQIGQIVLSILEIVMLFIGLGFVPILIMHAVIKLVFNIVLVIVTKRIYPEVNMQNKKKDYSFNRQLKDLIFHKINGLVGSNIDILIITRMVGLPAVAIYSTYNYIINQLKNILGKISGSLTAIIGNQMVRSKEKVYDLYLEFNSLLFFIATVICVPLTLAIDGFIDIWYEGEIKTSFMIAISFVAILFMFIVKMSTTTFVTSGGLYKETKYCALTDTIVNLTLSLTLAYFIGIPGVLIATAISVFIAEYILKTLVVHKHIFNKSPLKFFVKNIKFYVFYIIDLIVGYIIIDKIIISNILIWFVVFFIFTIINTFVIFIVYSIFKELIFLGRFKELVGKRKKK